MRLTVAILVCDVMRAVRVGVAYYGRGGCYHNRPVAWMEVMGRSDHVMRHCDMIYPNTVYAWLGEGGGRAHPHAPAMEGARGGGQRRGDVA